MFAEGLNCLAASCEDIRELVNTVEWEITTGEISC